VLFGAGQHTGWLMDIILEYRLLKPVLILDDNYEDEKFRGIPVVKPEDVEKDKIDVVVLSTDIWQRKFKKRVEEALPGMKTIDLYKGFVPGPYLLY
jgi:hypothetical protein